MAGIKSVLEKRPVASSSDEGLGALQDGYLIANSTFREFLWAEPKQARAQDLLQRVPRGFSVASDRGVLLNNCS